VAPRLPVASSLASAGELQVRSEELSLEDYEHEGLARHWGVPAMRSSRSGANFPKESLS